MQVEIDAKLDRKRKKTVVILFGLFMSSLLLLTLFSNTLQSMMLPKVNTAMPRKAKLGHQIEGTGVLMPQEEAIVKNAGGLKVKQLLVKTGEKVKKGQTLAQFDNRDAERQLTDERARLKQQQLALEKAMEDYIEAQRGGDEAAARTAKRSLDSQSIDIGIQERKIEGLQEQLSQQRELIAPMDGIVEEVMYDDNTPPAPGQPIARIVNPDKGFKLEITLPDSSASLVKVGDKMPVWVEGKGNKQVNGQVTVIDKRNSRPSDSGGTLSAGGKNDADAKTEAPKSVLVIEILNDGLSEGDQASITITKSASKERLLVPNGAVKEDAEGKYVLTVQENKGPLGNTFTVHKSYFQAEDANDLETAVERGLAPDVQIITESSEPLQEGNRIRLN